ncbi:LPS export ABC transporter permease LptF [Acidisoma cellulosilytica]|uniref:Lipopolysaccharide export system permease protein LptF n=1 Tax=Acidisoma cellulosilyticum TaxID=2802395 RepID=A0A964E497_9PROT|nr:LPS export ABC transporter permease LptF [Acidisoma cellulosilyticum]MCB8881057.1 LPS export ABC transporter permease LptF [Acidisoma cellulosilyticum]
MIIARYLLREITAPFLRVLVVLMVLFATYSAAGYLSDAASGLLPASSIVQLIGLKLLIAQDTLIPISLYVAVILAFGRMGGDSEITAMLALTFPPRKILGSVINLGVMLAIAVAVLSLYARPWAYARLHALAGIAAITLQTGAMEADTFYIGQHGRRVIFFARRAGPGAPAEDVFVQIRHDDYTEIISARLANSMMASWQAGVSQVHLLDAHIYRFWQDGTKSDQVLDAADLVLNPNPKSSLATDYSAVVTPSAALFRSTDPADIAELQWRLSTPLSTILLGLLGIPMSLRKGRQGRYARFGTAILAYFAYYLLFTSARTWVQHGIVPSLPGILWVPGALALVLLSMLVKPWLAIILRPRRRQA